MGNLINYVIISAFRYYEICTNFGLNTGIAHVFIKALLECILKPLHFVLFEACPLVRRY